MQTIPEDQRQSTSYKYSTLESSLLEIEREFKVPVEQLFGAFMSEDAIKAWWWPKGLHADRIDLDFREGGRYFINMEGSEGGGSGGMTGEFKELVENERIVMTDQFADQEGRVISAKEAQMPGTWPEVLHITFEFVSVDDTTSRLLLFHEGVPNEMQEECLQGWSESFDKLEAYLMK